MKKKDIATSSIGTVTGTATVIGGKAAAMGIATTFWHCIYRNCNQ